MKKELELYLHIPFCIKKCAYCDFLSGPAGIDRQRDYTDALCGEIEHCTEISEYRVSSVFIGGGTPSVLPGEWIEKILNKIREKFDMSPDAEVSIEANPGTVTLDQLEIYRRAGINRISFGCQSADNRELEMLGRIHTWEEFLESYRLARKAGFENINVDLMSGLPGQSLSSWEDTLRKTAELDPEHISAYSLIVEEGTPFYERELELPEEEEERTMYENTRKILESYGYHRYEISNYAKNGKECRHNIGYWRRTEYLGLGLGSASLIRETRFSNTSDMEKYLKYSKNSAMIREETEKLNTQSQMEECMILGLRMMKGVSSEEFRKNFGKELRQVYGDVIEKYVDMGFMEWDGDWIRLNQKGINVSNVILSEFIF